MRVVQNNSHAFLLLLFYFYFSISILIVLVAYLVLFYFRNTFVAFSEGAVCKLRDFENALRVAPSRGGAEIVSERGGGPTR